MDESRWKLIERLYEEVSEMPEGERARYFEKNKEADEAIRAEVNALLSANEEASGFFESFQGAVFSKIDDDPLPADDENGDRMVGQRIKQYEVLEKIGGGGMGAVYKARDINLDRLVALKVLYPHLSTSKEARDRFVIEAKAASQLSHPNVATIYAIEEIMDDQLAIAMMYCDGTSLKDLLKEGLLPIKDAVDIALQIAKGLYAAHKKGVIHRDVKPANVMLSTDGGIRIVDFGLARMQGQARITRTGNQMGTVAYMAPEQAKEGKADHRADIWSLGVVLYEMLAGQVPFYGEHIHSMLYALVHEAPVPIAGLRPGIPVQLNHLISKTLAKNPEQRYQQLSSLIEDLEAVAKGRETRSINLPGANEQDEKPLQPSSRMGSEKGPVKILVVDDEPDIELLLRQQYIKKIRAGEWHFLFAENGRAALEKLHADSEIHIVLTDIQMPVMDGLTLLSKLGEINRPIQTIVVSAYGDMRNIRTAMNNGAFDFLTKPIQFSDLERTIYKTIDTVVEMKLAREARVRLSALENELGFARKMQQQVLPTTMPASDAVEVYAYMEPAQEVNGDFYDYFYLDEHRLGFFIGDVSGKGFSAAMVMAMCRTLLKADAQRGLSPGACMAALNQFIYPEQPEQTFVTVFYGILDLKGGELSYCNAGQNPPFVLRSHGAIEQLDWTGGIAIGVKRDFDYQTSSATLDPSEGLFLYNDGLLRVKNQDGILFSESQLLEVLRAHCTVMPSQLIRHVVRAMTNHSMGSPQSDDITMLSVKRTL